MGDAAPSQSLFVVCCYSDIDPYFCSIVKLDIQLDSGEPWTEKEIESVDMKYLAHFKYPPQLTRIPINWLFVPPPSSTNNCYLVPYSARKSDHNFSGATYNCNTKLFQSIKPHKASKLKRHVVTVHQDIYFLPDPYMSAMYGNYDDPQDNVFERYIPAEDTWIKEVPFPFKAIHHRCYIVATVVWNDTILLNMDSCEFWAYNVSKREWYHINVDDDKKNSDLCYSIRDEGFVVNNTIYALSSKWFSSVMAISIKEEKDGDDLEFRCSLCSLIDVPNMTRILDENTAGTDRRFVHLGDDNFCLVQTCQFFGNYVYQPIQVTYMKLIGKDNMVVTNILKYRLSALIEQFRGQFDLGFCFSQPEGQTTTAIEQAETTFIFNPYDGSTDGTLRTNVIDDQKAPISIDKGGNFVIVSLPLGLIDQLVKEVDKIGRIQSVFIKNTSEDPKEVCCVTVTFESAVAKACVIKASPINIEGYLVDIVVNRRTSQAKEVE